MNGGGAILYVLNSGSGALTVNQSQLLDNPSDQFQTFPGIYDHIDGVDGPPILINSTDK